jgi:hypothetical protein
MSKKRPITYPPAFNWTPPGQKEGPRNWKQFLEDHEFEIHDNFIKGMMDYERLRLCLADEIDRTYPERPAMIQDAIGSIYQTTKAQTVVDFLNEVLRVLADQKMGITRAEVERHTLAFLWGTQLQQKAEIRKLKDRVRKYKKQ